MKKKIFILLIIIFPFYIVNATTYYSSYRQVDSYSQEESDIHLIKKIKKFNTYQLNKKILGYEIKDTQYCPKYDSADFVDGTFYREYTGQGVKSERYQSFLSDHGGLGGIVFLDIKEDVFIDEIEVYNKDELIKPFIRDASFENYEYLIDHDLKTGVEIKKGDTFFLVIQKPIPVKDVTIKLKSKSTIISDMLFIYPNTPDPFIFSYIDTNNINWVDKITYDEISKRILNFPNTDILSSYYRIEGRLYNCYEEEKMVTNKYMSSSENPNIMEDDFIIEEEHYIRDKIVLSDEIIKDVPSDLKKLIKESTISKDKIKVISNINYLKNGNYEVKFMMNDDFVITKKVRVAIKKQKITNKAINETKKQEIIPINKTPKIKEEETENIKYSSSIILIILIFLIIIVSYIVKRYRQI